MTVFFFFIFVFSLFLFCLPRNTFTFVLYYLAILAKHIDISPSASDGMRVLSLCLQSSWHIRTCTRSRSWPFWKFWQNIGLHCEGALRSTMKVQRLPPSARGHQGRTQHSSKVANEPPPPPPREKSTCVLFFFFFFFAFSNRGLVSHKIESKACAWVWQAFFCETRTQKIAIVKLEENCGGGRGRVGWVGRGPSRSRSLEATCERGAQGIAVRLVEAMWRSVAIKARPSKRNELLRAVFECLGGRL